MQLSSPAFTNGSEIPRRHTCDGEDVSVPLNWAGAPYSTQTFAILCEDPDAPVGIWRHWAIFDIPGEIRELPEEIPKQQKTDFGRQALNDFMRYGYGGPCPPHGHGVHRYRFRVLALSCIRLHVPADATCRDIADAARPHVLEDGTLVGTFARDEALRDSRAPLTDGALPRD